MRTIIYLMESYIFYVNEYEGPDITLWFSDLYILTVKNNYIINNRVWWATAYDLYKNVI